MYYYILYILCISIYIIGIIYFGKIFYKLYILKKKLKNNNTLIICNIITRYHIKYNIYKIFNIYDIDNYEDIILYLKKNTNKKINIILESSGGDIIASDNLINFILNSKIKLNIFVLNKAKSAATLLALSADKLFMNKFATLGPTDPQITIDDTQYSLRALINLCETKDKNYISDKMLITYYDSLNLYNENVTLIKKLLENKFIKNNFIKNKLNKEDFIDNFTYGDLSHHTSFNIDYLKKYIYINTDIPRYIVDIYNIFNDIFN